MSNIRNGVVSELMKKTNILIKNTGISPSACTDYSGRGQSCSGRELLEINKKSIKFINIKTNYDLGERGKFWI